MGQWPKANRVRPRNLCTARRRTMKLRPLKSLRNRWTRFQCWRLNRYADALLKEAEHHQAAAKMHNTAYSLFWSKANDVRAAAAKLLGGAS